MLEHATLLLLPWAAAPGGTPGGARQTRAVLDADTGRTLGFACRRPANLPRGLGWLARPGLDVYETEDASLLLRLAGPRWFAGGWEVFDAEEHRVGSLRGSSVRDRLGRPLARVVASPGRDALRFVTPSGYEPSALVRSAAGGRLTFAPDLVGDPFAKMLLLAAALVLTDKPLAA
jgi:hypothetical protein